MIKHSPDLTDGLYQGPNSDSHVRIVPERRGGLVELTSEESKIWQFLAIPKTRDEIRAVLKSEEQSVVSRLIRQGLLIDEDVTTTIPSQTDMVEIKENATFRGRALYLFLSDRCNLNCVYCYVPEDMRVQGKGIMPAEMMRKTVDEFLNHAKEKGVKDTEIRFLGGEPLFDRKLLLKTINHADAVAFQQGLNVQYIINTNGTYFDEKTIETLKPFASRLFMIVSIDGDKEVHNRLRPTLRGKPTYDKVMGGIHRLKANDFYVCPHAVVSSENMNQIPALMETIHDEFGITQLSYSFVHLPSEHIDGIRDLTVDEKMAVIRATHAKADELGMELTGHWKFSIAQRVTNSASLCEGGIATVCVTSNGDMYACQRHVGDPSKRLGNVTDGLVANLVRLQNARLAAWLNNMIVSHGGCSHCSLTGECGSKSATKEHVGSPDSIGVDMLEFQVYQGGHYPKRLDADGQFYDELLRFYLSNRPISTIRTTDFDKIINGMQPR